MNSIRVLREVTRVAPLLRTVGASGECRHYPLAIPAPACAAIFWGALSLAAFGQATAGLAGGITRDSSTGRPLAEVQVTARNLNKGTDRTTVSHTDGVFTFTDLEPGPYEFAAAKEGFQKSSAIAEVDAHRFARVELPLQPAADKPGTEKSTEPPLTEREKHMLERIERLEQRLAATEAAAEAKDSGATQATANNVSTNRRLVASTTPVPAAFPSSGAQVGKPAIPQRPTPVAPAEHIIPDSLQAPPAAPAVDNETPFAYGDFSWLNGSARTKDTVLDTKFFTPEIRFDTHYMTDFNQPLDHTIVGSTESFRSGEVQIEQASVGGDFHWENVRGRILFMEGLFATTTPRNDASSATFSGIGNTGGVGQWDLQNAYKYVSEAWGGYHFNVQHGLNVDAGIFVSYVGLFSYYNFDNWTYQPSYVSSNTPWFFEGARVQWFPDE